MNESKPNEQPQSYVDTLRETMQGEFPLLGEVTHGIVDDPLLLMNGQKDDDGVEMPCPLPTSMMQALPEMMSEPLSLYEDGEHVACCRGGGVVDALALGGGAGSQFA